MFRFVATILFSMCIAGSAVAQSNQDPGPAQKPSQAEQQKERSREAEAGESSSDDTRIDLSAPKDDAKNHPGAPTDVDRPSPDAAASSDVQEMRPWNPYRAVKDDEVGDFYFKQKNYRAALARYQDALEFKENDAVANFRMAQCYEKLNQPEQAIPHYREYLKILPGGPFAKDARKALEKLGASEKRETSQTSPPK
jgi:tetratricopeptide (TPR) repeat protein